MEENPSDEVARARTELIDHLAIARQACDRLGGLLARATTEAEDLRDQLARAQRRAGCLEEHWRRLESGG